MKIRGETEFTVSGTRTQEEVQAVAQQALDAFRAHEASILSAEAAFDSEHAVQIQVTLSATSYARAESLMEDLSAALSQALHEDSAATAVAGRSTELVPA